MNYWTVGTDHLGKNTQVGYALLIPNTNKLPYTDVEKVREQHAYKGSNI